MPPSTTTSRCTDACWRPVVKRGEGTLYRQQNSRFWWYRIGFQGRIICASTKTTDARAAREVLKQKYRELEVAKLVKHLPEDLHDFVWFAFLTGWRKGEIASLKWADVDEEAKTLRLSWRKSKNSQARTMALAGELANIMKRCGRRPPNERHRPRDDDRFRRVLGVVQGQADQPGGLRRLHPQANWRRLLDNSSARGVRRQPGRDPRYEGRSSTDPCRVRARCRGRMGQQGACLSRVISKGEGDGDRRSNTGRIPLERTAPRAGKWVASARKCGARTWPTGSRTPSGASGARARER